MEVVYSRPKLLGGKVDEGLGGGARSGGLTFKCYVPVNVSYLKRHQCPF